MKFLRSKIPDIIVIEPDIYFDNRGYFLETFNKKYLEEFLNCTINFCQDNESKSAKNVLRGLHYQIYPFAQSKLVRVVQGKILDVAVDIRYGSPTFGNYIAIELNSKNMKQLFIPKGFAHGFLALSDEVIVAYKVDNYYSKHHERGIAFDDSILNIDWACNKDQLMISEKDRMNPTLDHVEDLFKFGCNYE
ncbi:dTDP-4-dehydrorhamnose 3,5-epimerase [Campylobacter curvus]|uniref:dTDP-4-dehydrorhamnose 3,5-epimerase n=1 Tax=Campylobacter curvus (strain 525.92) TaxID=360105 RepID=A0A0M4SFQ7_CAMC5|nr:dTDP-4-dehydrorhamnose 3,5-epimerase [Campylobacter curvus]ALF45128.1 dTDP-4-dehydrorhamnose 3,5-epimerase [Campylobacter curvus 525.92]